MSRLFHHYDPNCPECKGSGEMDSGGIHPWGAPALIECKCPTEWMRPCPWCGVTPTLTNYTDIRELGWCVCCDNENCVMSEIAVCGYPDGPQAMAAWNSELWKPEADRTPHDCPWCSEPCVTSEDYDPRFAWEWAAHCANANCVSRCVGGGVHLTSGHRYKTQQEALAVFGHRYNRDQVETTNQKEIDREKL